LYSPTANPESDAHLRPDDEVYGVTYEDIDNLLEGKPVAEPTRERIFKTYRTSGHKRALPVRASNGIVK
jgi:NAD+ synthase